MMTKMPTKTQITITAICVCVRECDRVCVCKRVCACVCMCVKQLENTSIAHCMEKMMQAQFQGVMRTISRVCGLAIEA